MHRFRDAFISYGRKDSKAFTGWLCDRLMAAGLDAWYDQNDIPLGVDYQNQIDDGIAQSHNFLFIISPHSVHSAYCRKEIELAVQLRKRIIPLLHVGEISRTLWQERNPNGTDEEWNGYQQKGLHSSFVPNMHPVIEKINWVYFQEGIDDYDKGLAGLFEIVERQKSYVHQHTWLLYQAMEWERHHRSSHCLLIGQERKAAEDWLRVRFDAEQPPCEPTDLHCEFIGESIKNANNLMTRVFLCAAPGDGAIADRIRKSLLRESIIVWTNQSDINSGENQETAINRGIEGADQMIYLVSPESAIAPTCERELTYALSLHKRVIPIQVATLTNHLNPDLPDAETAIWPQFLPEPLRGVQHIDVTHADDPIRYQRAIAQLIQELNEEATYYEQHKILLVKTLKWQAQNQNSSLLLRGYNLDYARAWLTTARTRSHHPMPLIETFIAESQKLPPNRTLEVFISYSRTDSDFARKLNDALQTQGKTTWFDQESIASGTDFQQEIYRGIECAENFLFILSPSSVRSPYCADEVNYARDRNKRIITVLHRLVDTSEMPEALASVQWIDFTGQQGDFYTHFNELVRTLETDRDYIHQHAQWWLRAREWEQQQYSKDLLLRGSEYAIAEAWFQKADVDRKHPPVTALHRRYLQESERAIAAARRQEQVRQWILRGLLAGMSVAFLLVFRFWRQAQTIQESQISAVGRYSGILLANNQQIPALVEAIRGGRLLQDHRTTPETENKILNALRNVMVQASESNSLQAHDFGINWAAYSPDGKAIATASADHTAALWTPDGQQIAGLSGHQGEVTSIRFSTDGQTIATASQDGTVKLWDRQGKLLQTLNMPPEARNEFQDVAFSPDGRQLVAAGQDGKVYLWNQDGTLIKIFQAHPTPINGIGFSPNGQTLVTASDDRTIKLWNRNGTLIETFRGHEDRVLDIAFSPDGQTLASTGADNTARLWRLDGSPLVALRGHRGWVWSVSFSPDGQRLVTTSDDKTLKVWNREGQELNTLRGHGHAVVAGTFSPDGASVVSGGYDGMLKVWRFPTLQITTLTDFQAAPNRVQFSRDSQVLLTSTSAGQVTVWDRQGKLLSQFRVGKAIAQATLHPKGQTIITANDDGSVQLWTREGQLIRTFQGHTQKVVSVRFSPDGSQMITASEDGTACVWNLDGTRLLTLKGNGSRLTDVAFSPDGEAIATASFDNTVRLWDRQGNLLHTLPHPVVPTSISFSPDGQRLAAATELGRVLLWNRQGELLMTFSQDTPVLTVNFSPDGKFIATGSGDSRVTLWSAKGNQLQLMEGHRAEVTSVYFSPDGKTLASASADKTVRLWELDDRRLQEFAGLWSQGLEQLLQPACERARDFLANSQRVEEGDRPLCDPVLRHNSAN